jgi:hypothetical protein
MCHPWKMAAAIFMAQLVHAMLLLRDVMTLTSVEAIANCDGDEH